jgi:uncharacterized membrane protein
MKSRTAIFVATILILLTWGSSALLASRMPAMMVSHWGVNGEANGYASQFTGLWFLPLLQLGVTILLFLVPRLDPLKHNVASFENTYHVFIAGFAGFLAYIHGLTLAWNLSWVFDMNQAILPAFALLFFLAGYLLKNARQNYFIGIRTPWTLANTQVWTETHRVGGIGFQVAAIISLVGLLVPNLAMYFILIPVLLAAFGSVIYSYFLFQKYQPKS